MVDKQTLSTIIMRQLTQLGIEYIHGNETDISIAKEFLDTGWGTGDKKIDYEAYIFLDAITQTVYMYEKTTEDGKSFSFDGERESSFQSETTLFRKVKSVQYGPEGKTFENEFDLEAIPKMVKDYSKQNGWSFKTVTTKSMAIYPEGYLPPFIPPVYNPPAKQQKQEEERIVGYCENCGGPINQGVTFCNKCGAPAPLPLVTRQIAPASASTIQSPLYNAQQQVYSITSPSPSPSQQTPQQQPKYQQQTQSKYGNPQNTLYSDVPSEKNSKGGIFGLVGLIILSIIMILFLFVDRSPVISWGLVAAIFAITLFIQRKIAKKGFALNIVLLIVSTLIFLIAFGMTSTQISLAATDIKNGYMTTAIDSTGKPTDKVSAYKINTPQLIAVGELRNAPPSTHVKFVWIYVTSKVHIADYSMDNGNKGANIYIFSYLTNKKAWPKGEYKVEIYIEDRKTPDKTVNFTIK
jgi:hypothetical protein